jgi:cytoskeletal protein CcmA (bactofilin family)
MANIIKIKRGSGVPGSGVLAGYELGWDYVNNSLYLGVDGTNPIKIADAFDGYLSIDHTTGKLYATGDFQVDGDVTLGGSPLNVVNIAGIANVSGDLNVTGLSSLDGGIDVNGGKFTVAPSTGSIYTAGKLTVDGDSTLGDSSDDINIIRGIVTLSDLNRTTTVLGGLEVDQTFGVDGNVRVGVAGTTKASINATSGAIVTAGTLDVDGAVEFNSTLGVDGNTTLRNNLNVTGDVTFGPGSFLTNGTAEFYDDVTIGLSATTNTLTIHHFTELSKTLTVAGLASLDGGIDVNAKLTIDGATGDVATAGDITAENITVNGNLVVHGTTTTVDSTVVTIKDPVFTLGETLSVSDGKDRGIEFNYGDTVAPLVGFFGLDESTGRFVFIPDATNTSEVFSGNAGDFEVGDIYQGGVNVSDGWNIAAAATAQMTTGVQYDLLQHDGTIFKPTKTISADSGITIDCGTY